MGTMKNGRSTYEQLKGEYDKVIIRHFKKSDKTVKTICLLVRGLNVHVGVSKFSNRGDMFHRTKGRLIAQGRAEVAFDVFSGKTEKRPSMLSRREELSFTIASTSEELLEETIEKLLHE